jgi:plasmid maintenance system antidote protein VapI
MMPVEAFHPWEFIAEELEERGWTKDDLAERMGDCHPPEVHRLALDLYEEIRTTDIVVDQGMAKSLALAFGTSEVFWLNLHQMWRDWEIARLSREEHGK